MENFTERSTPAGLGTISAVQLLPPLASNSERIYPAFLFSPAQSKLSSVTLVK